MSALWFLGFALVASVIGIVVVSLRARPPSQLDGIEDFARGLAALRPITGSRRDHHSWPRPGIGAVGLEGADEDGGADVWGLAIDLGTANTLVFAEGHGIVLNEPSVIAVDTTSGDVLAMGHEARQMIGRTPGHIVAVRPLRQGAITDFDITQRMIRLVLEHTGVSRFNRATVVVCVPSAITEVERRAVVEAARRAGAGQAHLIDQPVAAAVGAGLPIHEPLGNMVVDVGGGTSESAVISLGGVVALEALRIGSFDFDAAIQTYIRREYGMTVGERTAEEIKIALGSATDLDDHRKIEVRGRELATGMAATVVLGSDDVRAALAESVGAVVGSVLACLGQAPPDLAHDLIDQGIHLVGGGALLAGLDQRLADECGVPVRLVEAPLESVVMGAGRCLEHFDDLHTLFASSWVDHRRLSTLRRR